MTRMSHNAGFTLLEMMIVLLLLGLLGMAGQQLLSQSIAVWDRVRAADTALLTLERDIDTLQHDFRHAANRPAAIEGRDARPFIADSKTLTFSCMGAFAQAQKSHRSQIQQVRYTLDSMEILRRSERPALNPSALPFAESGQLLSGAKNLQFTYLDELGRWGDVWPPLRAENEPAPPHLPLAVLLKFHMAPFGDLSRTIRIEAQ